MATTVQAASHSLENSSWPLMGWLSILPIVLYGTFCSRIAPPGCALGAGAQWLAKWQAARALTQVGRHMHACSTLATARQSAPQRRRSVR